MSEQKRPGPDQPYSVDDILAEFGSKSREKPSKVREFTPGAEPPSDPRPKTEKPHSAEKHQGERGQGEKPAQPSTPQPMDEIVPQGVRRNLAARLSTLIRRADNYADHMYDQAEPDEETRKAEKYIPGVDREEVPPQTKAHKPKRARRPVEIPPDTPPAELAAQWRKGLKSLRVRTTLSFLCAVAAVAVSLDLPFLNWDAFSLPILRPALLAGLLAVTGLLCLDVILRGIVRLFTLKPGAESLCTLAWAFTLADSCALLFSDGPARLSCGAVTAVGLACALRGTSLRQRGDRLSAKAAAQARSPYRVTLDENKWSGRPAFTKWSGSTEGFGSQMQMDDGVTRAYRIAAPLLILACLICALLASVARGNGGRFLWSASCAFTATASFSALLAYGSPYHKLAARLYKTGAALAGWPGAARCRQAGVIMTDLDLFPPGSIHVAQFRVFNGVSVEKAVSYTATLLRVLNCGLTRPFYDLLRAQGGIYREASGVVPHEGGLSGIIRNQEVLVGTSAFMHMMNIDLPQGLNIKNAVYCAISGQLAGMFPLDYDMSDAVKPSLSALMQAGVSPVLATRDFNLIPALLEQKFKLPVDRLEFPPVERRLELSRDDQEHDDVPVAVLCREGLTAYSDAVVGGRRLRSAVIWSLVFALAGAVVGLLLTFYLTAVGAYGSLTPLSFLVFMLAWLVPELLLSNWVNLY